MDGSATPAEPAGQGRESRMDRSEMREPRNEFASGTVDPARRFRGWRAANEPREFASGAAQQEEVLMLEMILQDLKGQRGISRLADGDGSRRHGDPLQHYRLWNRLPCRSSVRRFRVPVSCSGSQ